MNKRNTALTKQIQQQIVSTIRGGAFAHVAGLAWGVKPERLADWITRGTRPGAREPYRSFAVEVFNAQGQARAKAEMELYQKDPRAWLEHGPGRDKPHSPGWAAPVRAHDGQAADSGQELSGMRARQIFLWMFEQLTDYPEARLRISDNLGDAPLSFEKQPFALADIMIV